MTTVEWTDEDQRDADELDAIYDYLYAVYLTWKEETGRNWHVDRHGNRHGYADDGTPIDTPHHYDPEFLAFAKEWGELEAEDLAEGMPPYWRDYARAGGPR